MCPFSHGVMVIVCILASVQSAVIGRLVNEHGTLPDHYGSTSMAVPIWQYHYGSTTMYKGGTTPLISHSTMVSHRGIIHRFGTSPQKQLSILHDRRWQDSTTTRNDDVDLPNDDVDLPNDDFNLPNVNNGGSPRIRLTQFCCVRSKMHPWDGKVSEKRFSAVNNPQASSVRAGERFSDDGTDVVGRQASVAALESSPNTSLLSSRTSSSSSHDDSNAELASSDRQLRRVKIRRRRAVQDASRKQPSGEIESEQAIKGRTENSDGAIHRKEIEQKKALPRQRLRNSENKIPLHDIQRTTPDLDHSKNRTRKKTSSKYSQKTSDVLAELHLSHLELDQPEGQGQESQEDQDVGAFIQSEGKHQDATSSDKNDIVEITSKMIGFDIKPINITEQTKMWKWIQFHRRLNQDAQWACLCMVVLIVLSLWALWYLGGWKRCRYKPPTILTGFEDDSHVMDVIELMWRKRKYLPMFTGPEVKDRAVGP